MTASTDQHNAVDALTFQASIRQWCERMGLPLNHNGGTPWVGLLSQGNAENLAQWSLVGMGVRQEITLNQNGLLIWQQPSGEMLSTQISTDATESLWEPLEKAKQQCQTYSSEFFEQPFMGGLVGLLSYEASPYCDDNLNVPGSANLNNFPVMVWRECEHWALWHHASQSLMLLSANDGWRRFAQECWANCLKFPANLTQTVLEKENSAEEWTSSLSTDEFSKQVDVLQQAIRDGECYQANLSMRFERTVSTSPWEVFSRVSQSNPSPFAGVWQCENGVSLVSNSPERLVNVSGQPSNQWASSRPIAGTRGRGQTDADDQSIGETLHTNAKERAEHLMLVDLLRNDIGKIAAPGTVNVDELMVLERYSHVTHLVSNVVGELAPEKTSWEVLQAVFPGGTITGCPKVRCCQWLANCEPVSRGLYTGSMGYIDATTGQMDFNILIRSAMMVPTDENQWHVQLHAGAGIVLDSVAEHEYRECLRKAEALMSVFDD